MQCGAVCACGAPAAVVTRSVHWRTSVASPASERAKHLNFKFPGQSFTVTVYPSVGPAARTFLQCLHKWLDIGCQEYVAIVVIEAMKEMARDTVVAALLLLLLLGAFGDVESADKFPNLYSFVQADIKTNEEWPLIK